MKKVVIVICMLLIGGGCARAWYSPNKTLEQCRQDFLECNLDAIKASYPEKYFGRYVISAGMQERGRKENICGSCMRARGYGLIPVKQLPTGVRQAPTSYGSWYIAGR